MSGGSWGFVNIAEPLSMTETRPADGHVGGGKPPGNLLAGPKRPSRRGSHLIEFNPQVVADGQRASAE